MKSYKRRRAKKTLPVIIQQGEIKMVSIYFLDLSDCNKQNSFFVAKRSLNDLCTHTERYCIPKDYFVDQIRITHFVHFLI